MAHKAMLYCGAMALAGWLNTSAAGAAAPGQTGDSASTVQEVVVTARKRAESLQTIPQAVSALNGSQLERQGIRGARDLQRSVPGLQIPPSLQSVTGIKIGIRGQLASDYLLTVSQPVGLYEDSVNIPHPAGTDLALFDLERVEVLRGPQGTLYGRNTTGGALNIITRGPDYDGYHGYVLGEVGNYSDWKVGGAVNVPLVKDVLSVRLAAQHWYREGFGKSLVTGERLGDSRNDDIVRATVRFDPVASFTSRLEVEYFHAKRAGALYQTGQLLSPAIADQEWVLEGRPGGLSPTQVVGHYPDRFTNYSITGDFDRVTGWHVAWDSTWHITDSVDLRSITGMHQFTDFQAVELGGATVQTFGEGLGVGGKSYVAGRETLPLDPDQQSTQWSQEFNLSGRAFENRLNWLVGAFYSRDRGNENQTASVYPALINAAGFTAFDVDFYDPRVTSKTWGLFTQDDIKISDVFSITAGYRYSEEKLASQSSFMLHLLGPNVFVCQAGANLNVAVASRSLCLTQEAAKASGSSYLLSFNFQFTRDILLYLKTARGFRGGTLQERAPGTEPARPETDIEYEIGLKADLLDGRIRSNIALYRTKYANKQEQAIVGLPSGAVFTPIVNAATARIQGVEAELTAIPTPGLTLNANATFMEGVYTNYPNALTPWGTVIPNASGTAFANPRWVLDIAGRYTHPVGPGEAAVTLDYNWTSKVPTTLLNNDPSLSPSLQHDWRTAIGLLNATLEYRLPEQGLTFTVFASNLTNEHYQRYAFTFASPPAPWGYTGVTLAPRMYGITIRKSFGGGE
ncbi:MAG: hypothetical protein JWQ97_1668 [Phenylobacterium sp.]|nr:hypothetical protein [Phenylobacterium sp.]